MISQQQKEHLQSESMTVGTFIANLGGQMGLWLGASVVTIVQVIVVVLSFCIGRTARDTE